MENKATVHIMVRGIDFRQGQGFGVMLFCIRGVCFDLRVFCHRVKIFVAKNPFHVDDLFIRQILWLTLNTSSRVRHKCLDSNLNAHGI